MCLLNNSRAYHVEWFVTHEIQADVTVRIVDGRLDGVESGCARDAIDLGRVALISGLVNAHTHLEFSDLAAPIPTTGRFTDWIRSVVAHRRAHPSQAGRAISRGLQESLSSGTTTIGEIATAGWTSQDYAGGPLRSVVFQELLGLTPDRVAQQKELARSHATTGNALFVPGLSPHAPYSTHLELVREAVELAQQTGCPLAMHLAETRAEVEFLRDRTGEFREMLTDFGIWNNDPMRFGYRALEYLQILARAPRALIIHGNYLDDEELAYIASHPNMTLVYCPRTHAAFGHGSHPWRAAIDRGIRVALGTDSRASNPDLSLFAELQFLSASSTDLSQLELLQLGSTNGLLGLGIENNPAADFTLVRPNGTPIINPDRDLFARSNSVTGTMVNGHWMWADSQLVADAQLNILASK